LASKLNEAFMGTITDIGENSTFITNTKIYNSNVTSSPMNKN